MAENTDSNLKNMCCVQDFLDKWSEAIPKAYSDSPALSLDEYMNQNMQADSDMLEELANVCGESSITCDEEADYDKPGLLSDVPDGLPSLTPLVTVGLQKVELDKRKKHPLYKKRISYKMKYSYIDGPGVHQYQKNHQRIDTMISDENIVSLPECILTVKVFRPYNHRRDRKPKLNSVHDVLSCQSLTELRDVIQCPMDLMVLGEYSDNPHVPKDIRAKDLYKSGLFLIEDTFYNDMRDANARDYSSTIKSWATEPDRKIRKFEYKKMEEARFRDLKIRLGHPYLYLHQGNCEHIITFWDIRMIHCDDLMDKSQYPVCIGELKERHVWCRVCSKYNASWVVTDNELCPEDPCFFCETCFKSFHYDKHGNKLMDFKAYPYLTRFHTS